MGETTAINLGIIVAISKYPEGQPDLPGCAGDAKAMTLLLNKETKFDEVLIIDKDTNSASIKAKLTGFIEAYDGSNVDNLVFYYSGHGDFDGNEFYYLLSDYEASKKKQTSLENSELDNLLRSINAELTVKIVDACQSGVNYIKDTTVFDKYLESTKGSFKRCYFMYSSNMDQSSYQDCYLSHFTRSIIDAIMARDAPDIRYKDIMDYVSDKFIENAQQSPFFITQAKYTERFCIITDSVKKALGDFVSANRQVEDTNTQINSTPSLTEKVEEEAKSYCSEEEAFDILEKLATRIEEYNHPNEAKGLYNIETIRGGDYSEIPNIDVIGTWLSKNENAYFADPVYETVHYKAEPYKPPTLGYKKPSDNMYYSTFTYGGISGDERSSPLFGASRVTKEITRFRATLDMPYKYIIVKASAKHPNISGTACILVPVISKTDVRLFICLASYSETSWGKEEIDDDVQWSTGEFLMKDDAAMITFISETINKYWNHTLNPLKKRFGIISSDELNNEQSAGNGEEEKEDNSPPTED